MVYKSIAELADHLEHLLQTCDPNFARKDPISARRAGYAAKLLSQRCFSPMENTAMMGWQEPARVMAIKIALDLGVFEQLKEQKGKLTIEQIIAKSKAHPELVERIMRTLGSWQIVSELESRTYGSTHLSEGLTDAKVISGIDFWMDYCAPAFSQFPITVEKQQYRDPSGTGNWTAASGSDMTFWPWLNEHPKSLQTFTNHMQGLTAEKGAWVDEYPIEQLWQGEQDEDAPLIVDVGGGVGHDMEKFRAKAEEQMGFQVGKARIIVQDQASVVEQGIAQVPPLSDAIKFMAHDFFTPQPVKGARAYFLHAVLHDWQIEKGQEILSNIIPAMKKGYSRILLGDTVMPLKGAAPYSTSQDLVVLALAGGGERTVVDIKKQLEGVGLKIVKIWTAPGCYESVVEAELA